MKKPLAVTLLTGAILALAAPAIGAPPNVSVTGGGTIVDESSGGTVHVTVSARKPAEAPNEDGRGNVTIKFPGEPAVHGTVDCLVMGGSESAAVTGQLNNGLFFNIQIQDGEQSGERDQAQIHDLGPDPLDCKARDSGEAIVNGGFQVRDLSQL